MKLIFILLLSISNPNHVHSAIHDETIEKGKFGKEVVDIVCQRIKSSCLFPEDFKYLRKMASLETHDGVDSKIRDRSGIWGVKKKTFDIIKNKMKEYKNLNQQIIEYFEVNWSNVTFSDLEIPLLGGLAAILDLEFKVNSSGGVVPQEDEEQAKFWRKNKIHQNKFFNYRIYESCPGAAEVVFALDGSKGMTSQMFNFLLNSIVLSVNSHIEETNDLNITLVQFAGSKIKVEVEPSQELSEFYKNISYMNKTEESNLTYLFQFISNISKTKDPKLNTIPKVLVIFTTKFNNISKIIPLYKETLKLGWNVITFPIGKMEKKNYDYINILNSDEICVNHQITKSLTGKVSLETILSPKICKAPFFVDPGIDFQVLLLEKESGRNCRVMVKEMENGTTIEVKVKKNLEKENFSYILYLMISENVFPNELFYDKKYFINSTQPIFIFLSPSYSFPSSIPCYITKTTKDSHLNEHHGSEIPLLISNFPGRTCNTFPCERNSTCVDLPSSNDYQCMCVGGYAGRNCQWNDLCISNPCLNNSTCSMVTKETYYCMCQSGFAGKVCDFEDLCYKNPCQNKGKCEMIGENEFKCDCAHGFYGINCELKDGCASFPCMNEGLCKRIESGRHQCKCKGGFTGANCDWIDPCFVNRCLNQGHCEITGNNTFNCKCTNGFKGVTCQIIPPPCKNHPCQHNGTCIQRGEEYICTCSEKTFGKNCEKVLNKCMNTKCLNGGLCEEDENGVRCKCLSGYEGDFCQVVNSEQFTQRHNYNRGEKKIFSIFLFIFIGFLSFI